MKPGMTIVPEQSTTSASVAEMLGRTSAINFPSIGTSALSKSPTTGSRLSTTPPFSRMRRLRPSPMVSWVSTGVADRTPASGVAAKEAPANPAAARNSRRDEEFLDMFSLSETGLVANDETFEKFFYYSPCSVFHRLIGVVLVEILRTAFPGVNEIEAVS